ncbi:MAG: Mov34/MPN/PAD-1 family protein [Polyangiaceae bacterium]|nr:Mov34/MPN/PAD-1 family protein [Polyangiaceae bacterium]
MRRGVGRVEVLFLVDGEGRILWSDASGSPVALPDSRARWEAIWQHREALAEIVHSHPVGPLAFSSEDEATMEALSSALGRAPLFSVVAPGGMVRRVAGVDVRVEEEPWWAALLRQASGMGL